MKNAPLEDLHLPVPNLFIPDNLSLKSIPDKVLVALYLYLTLTLLLLYIILISDI